jgi:hypothetical protein
MKPKIRYRLGIAALLTGLVLAGASGCGGSDDEDPPADTGEAAALQEQVKDLEAEVAELQDRNKKADKETAPSDPTKESEAPSGDVHSYEMFESETGNIACALSDTGARCDIAQKSWSPPPKPSDCDLDWGMSLSVEDGPGQFVCAGDTVRSMSAPVLEYGDRAVVGSFACDSASTGVTCTNTETGHGFMVAKGEFDTF